MSRTKKKILWHQYIGMVAFMLIGATCGILMTEHLDNMIKSGKSPSEYLFLFALLVVGMYITIFLQIVIHEVGHLIFGLLTGYGYSSFRVGSFMWIKENGKMRFRRLSIAGMGGQCLMTPPEMVNEKMPYALYNLGGPLMNVISTLLFWGLYLVCRNVLFLSVLFEMAVVIGFAFALMNGIPMRLGTIDNDGYNALSLGKSPEALRSFWIQMKVNEQIAKGIRLKNMPEEWFAVPSPEEMKNSMTAVMGVFACNRLMDAHEFEKADQLMDELLQMDTAIVGLHRSLMVCDRIYCELITEKRQDVLNEMRDKQQNKFMKAMKNFPTVLRTEYAYALLAEKQDMKASKIKERFEKCSRTYPHPSEIESERELMAIAEKKSVEI